jgi:small subunit ribosomal protein S15
LGYDIITEYQNNGGDIHMALTKEAKAKAKKNFQLHERDTGSADVQIALLTERINELTKHLQSFKKDFASRRALLKMVGQRRRLLDFLNSSDNKRYHTIIKKLDLRK